MTRLRLALIACVRPLLTLLCVTLPRWWRLWLGPQPMTMPPAWRVRQDVDDAKRGWHP